MLEQLVLRMRDLARDVTRQAAYLAICFGRNSAAAVRCIAPRYACVPFTLKPENILD
jgi:hypothetical protein